MARVLGAVRVGVGEKLSKPWAQTNDGENRVNLTLELKPEQLELDLVGWKEGQSQSLKRWLQSAPGERAVNELQSYEVVAFVRRAYKKTATSTPWWQEETIQMLGACPAEAFIAGWLVGVTLQVGSPKEEKAAFHLRRAWPRDEADALGGGALPAVIAREVERLLPILQQIWASS